MVGVASCSRSRSGFSRATRFLSTEADPVPGTEWHFRLVLAALPPHANQVGAWSLRANLRPRWGRTRALHKMRQANPPVPPSSDQNLPSPARDQGPRGLLPCSHLTCRLILPHVGLTTPIAMVVQQDSAQASGLPSTMTMSNSRGCDERKRTPRHEQVVYARHGMHWVWV